MHQKGMFKMYTLPSLLRRKVAHCYLSCVTRVAKSKPEDIRGRFFMWTGRPEWAGYEASPTLEAPWTVLGCFPQTQGAAMHYSLKRTP